MKEYVAKTNTGVYPYGVIRRGEVLQAKHIEALGAQGLADLLERNVIAVIADAPEKPEEPGPADQEREPEENDCGDISTATEDYDEDDALDGLELPGLEDTVGDAEEPAGETKPAAKKKTGRSRAK